MLEEIVFVQGYKRLERKRFEWEFIGKTQVSGGWKTNKLNFNPKV